MPLVNVNTIFYRSRSVSTSKHCTSSGWTICYQTRKDNSIISQILDALSRFHHAAYLPIIMRKLISSCLTKELSNRAAVFIPKRLGYIHLCIDYCKLKTKDAYPLPLAEVQDQLAGSSVFFFFFNLRSSLCWWQQKLSSVLNRGLAFWRMPD